MKKNYDQNVCIRIDRNESQIIRCKERLEEVDVFIQDYAQILQLAGNSVRMKILILLQEGQRLCVCDLGEVLEMKIPAVSQHLRKLKDAKLVLTEREGVTIFYLINPEYQPIMATIFNRLPIAEVI